MDLYERCFDRLHLAKTYYGTFSLFQAGTKDVLRPLVDTRRRLDPPVPSGYMGHMLIAD